MSAVESHVRTFFHGHAVEAVHVDLGEGRRAVVPELRVLVVAPGPRGDCWSYVTAGCWAAAHHDGNGLEFVLTTHVRDERFLELMGMIAYYHCGDHRLDLEHSLPIGRPWVPGSKCDHLLISRPYLHGPELEHCPLPDGHVRVLWAMPVTTAAARARGAGAAVRRGGDRADRSVPGLGRLIVRRAPKNLGPGCREWGGGSVPGARDGPNEGERP